MPSLNTKQKLFLAATGVVIILFQLYKFAENGIEGTGWVLSLVAASLLILPALSIQRIKPAAIQGQKINEERAKAVLSPDSNAQALYKSVLLNASELNRSIVSWLNLPPLKSKELSHINEPMLNQWKQYSIAYSACLMIASQIKKDMSFAKTDEFLVIYGQSIKAMAELALKNAAIMGVENLLTKAKAETQAKKDMSEAEDALLNFIDSVSAKLPNPDAALLNYLTERIGVSEEAKEGFKAQLKSFTKTTMIEFSK
jgi:hypothetical protein